MNKGAGPVLEIEFKDIRIVEEVMGQMFMHFFGALQSPAAGNVGTTSTLLTAEHFQAIVLEKVLVLFQGLFLVNTDQAVVPDLAFLPDKFLDRREDDQRHSRNYKTNDRDFVKAGTDPHSHRRRNPYDGGRRDSDDPVILPENDTGTYKTDPRHDIRRDPPGIRTDLDRQNREQGRAHRNQDQRPQPCRLAPVLPLGANNSAKHERDHQFEYVFRK